MSPDPKHWCPMGAVVMKNLKWPKNFKKWVEE